MYFKHHLRKEKENPFALKKLQYYFIYILYTYMYSCDFLKTKLSLLISITLTEWKWADKGLKDFQKRKSL